MNTVGLCTVWRCTKRKKKRVAQTIWRRRTWWRWWRWLCLQVTEQFVPLAPVHGRGFLGGSLLTGSFFGLGQRHAQTQTVSSWGRLHLEGHTVTLFSVLTLSEYHDVNHEVRADWAFWDRGLKTSQCFFLCNGRHSSSNRDRAVVMTLATRMPSLQDQHHKHG